MIPRRKKMQWMVFYIIASCVSQSLATPVTSEKSLAMASDEETEKEGVGEIIPESIHIYKMQVNSQISNRFVHTTVVSNVKNYAKSAQKVTFSIVLPDTAFISSFVMEIEGKNYTAYVKEKEEAKKTYDQAVGSGQSAAHVAVSARDSNRFTVSVNIEAQSKAAFYLSYEELLKRQEGRYELVINLHPGQPVKDLSVKVTINESRKIIDLKVPPLRSGNEIGNEKEELDPRADITKVDEKDAVITFNPNLERQKVYASLLGTQEKNGIAGQFVVQYDVERDPQGGEVLVQDGYFVHFFAPSELERLPKHVVFVLDTSGSMHGQKIVQLRESMVKILEELNEQDMFQLVEFNSVVQVLNIDDQYRSVKYPSQAQKDKMYRPLNSMTFGAPYIANAENIKKAKLATTALSPRDSTDIFTALEVGLHLVELSRLSNNTRQPIIIFLTDGDPNVRIRSTSKITSKISEYNSDKRKSSIFTLAFGNRAKKDFLQKLASRNNGFARQIYEAADASLQLQNFYKQVSSPLLANVSFKYESSTTSVTVTAFPIHFQGSELVVAGCYAAPDFIPPVVEAHGRLGPVILKATVQRSVSSLERLWAYLTVKQLLEKKKLSDKETDDLKKKALEVALKYQFVTTVSSLVLVKPNSTNAVDTESAAPKGTWTSRLRGRTASRSRVSKGSSSSRFRGRTASRLRIPEANSAVGIDDSLSVRTANHSGVTLAMDKPTAIFHQRHDDITPRLSQAPKQDIFSALPWLKQILTNGVLTLSKGNYKLGLNETITVQVKCSNAPSIPSLGHCTLIHSCEVVHSRLVSKDVYEQHFCILKNEYAGVCCPE